MNRPIHPSLPFLPPRSSRAWVSRFAVALAAALVLSAGCRRPDPTPSEPTPPPRTETFHYGPIRVEFTAQPPRVHLDRDMVLSLRIVAPADLAISLPNIEDRLEGFTLNGVMDSQPVRAGASVSLERRILLTPLLADEYRVAPIPVTYLDNSRNPPEPGWFATRPLVLEAVQPPPPGDGIRGGLSPVWIPPSPATVLGWVVILLGLAALALILSRVGRKVQRQIRLMRMSPRERALHELAELIARDLVARERFQDFYVELTMIVRRYIERAHAIRAPEQTTDEFLAAVGRDPRFPSSVVQLLREFLQAADLVKFAARRPAGGDIDRSTETARAYIESDSARANPDSPGATPGGR